MFIALALAATLEQHFLDIAKTSGGHVGAYAEVVETGTAASLNADEPFPMQSVYKLPIAMAVLDLVDKKQLALTHRVRLTAADMAPPGLHSPLRDAHPRGDIDVSVRDLIRDAIVESDGTASDALFRLGGGADALTAYVRRIGVTGITIAATEARMARDEMVQYTNSATPRAAAMLLERLVAGRAVSAASRDLLLGDLAASTPGARRLKGLLPKGTAVAHKTGTDGTHNGLTRATNDIGIITLPNGRHLAIAVFVKDSTADEPTREATIAKIARAAYDEWSAK